MKDTSQTLRNEDIEATYWHYAVSRKLIETFAVSIQHDDE